MTLAMTAMPSLHLHGLNTPSKLDHMESNAVHAAMTGAARKRKRSRKVHSDRKFDCTFEGCGKSYSRAEHLYRHQLNHTPKQIYRCDFPDCYRSFVRQDLCIRHRERHTTQGSQLQKRDHFTQAAATHKPVAHPILESQGPPVTSSPFIPASTAAAAPPLIPITSSPGPMGLTRAFSHPAGLGVVTDPVFPRSSSANNQAGSSPSVHSAATFGSPALHKAACIPFDGRQSVAGSIGSNDLETRSHPALSDASPTATTRAPDANASYAMSTDMNASSLVNPASYGTQAGLQVPVSGYADIPMAPTSAPAVPANMGSLDSMSGMMPSDGGFDSFGSVYPMFGGESYARSPFAMADDFTAWLFNDPGPTTPSVGGPPSAANMMPPLLDASQVQNQFFMGDAAYNHFLHGVVPNHPMSVTSILDGACSPRAIMSEDKRQELLHLMATRFNEAAYSAVAKRKDALMDGDLDDDRHVLSLRMIQTYIGSYWYHFHSQLPILHRPTFNADQAPNLLLLAVIAIGAATLDEIHGAEVTEAASELANFIVWHLRWEIFMDADFRPPAKLWVFQSLLLLEVYEKMYSTRALHERAHIHHDTTLTLMRRGSSLIGRSAFDSPAGLKEDERTRSASLSAATPDVGGDESWTNWIKAEATRRVAFAAFVLDSTHATMFGHSAKMVAHELRLPLPCDEALWSATSGAEVARVQSSLHANGVKPVLFLDGLKRTLNGQRVRTNAFGRTILMSGLLSVSWHMNQRDLQVSSLGVPQALGGRDKWRTSLLRAFDHWRRDFDEALGQTESPLTPNGGRRGPHALDEDNVFESRDVLHGLAHMASHVDIVDCQIFAGADRLMGRSITPRDYSAAREKMTERWATKASARDAAFYALKFLSECLLSPRGELYEAERYSGRDDCLLNRPWVIYVAALVVWCYGFALEGPITPAPQLNSAAEQRADMQAFLTRVGGVNSPNDLEMMPGRNQSLGLLMILRDGFMGTRWELLAEAAELLGRCIDKLQGINKGL